MNQCIKWLKTASESKSPGHFDKMMGLCKQLYALLQKLDPNTPLNFDYLKETEEETDPEELNERTQLAMTLTEVVPGFDFQIYMEALKQHNNDMDKAVNFLFSLNSGW